MQCSTRSLAAGSAALLLVASASAASAVGIDWVDVGDPGNGCDSQVDGCFGAVATPYKIARHEVTNSQYTEFLNAVAASDPNALYNTSMAWAGSGHGGINRSGSPGSYSYAAAGTRENIPVNNVSFYDALRFANWMHNGQPSGAQGAGTTETGSYSITAQGITDNSILRNANASVALASEDEWYKAAYYDAFSTSYNDYPAGSDMETACAEPTAAANSANCGNAIGSGTGALTPVGSYPGSLSPYGTADQGGNLWEWNEAVLIDDFRGLRGGAFNHMAERLNADYQSLNDPHAEASNHGFRLVLVPEPGSALLVAAGLLGLAVRRRSV